MSEISVNTVENIDEVEQIIFLTTCTTKLLRCYRVTLHSLDVHPPFINSRFYYLRESIDERKGREPHANYSLIFLRENESIVTGWV